MSEQATVIRICDAAAASVNAHAGELVIPPTAARRAVPLLDLKQIADGQPAVLSFLPTGGLSGSRESADAFDWDIEVRCVIQRRVGVGDAAESAIAQCLLLAEQVADLFRSQVLDLGDALEALLVRVDAPENYMVEVAVQEHVFEGGQSLFFRVVR